MKKIIVPEKPFLMPEFIKELQSLKAHVEIYDDFPVDQEHARARVTDADILIVDIVTKYDEYVLESAPNLKGIVTTSVGVDHIDAVYCEKEDIKIINFPGYNARGVAEMAFANLISLLRKVPQAQRNVRAGAWDYDLFQGTELAGKTLGVIGAGNIGRELIQIGKGLGMNVVVNTKRPSFGRAKELGISGFASLNELLKVSDFVVIAVPMSPETENMINKESIEQMKNGAYIINIARWKIVDALALANAIYKGKIAGAALDVIAPEPFNIRTADLRIQEMIHSPNVILTPHCAGNTVESNIRLGQRLIKEVKNLL